MIGARKFNVGKVLESAAKFRRRRVVAIRQSPNSPGGLGVAVFVVKAQPQSCSDFYGVILHTMVDIVFDTGSSEHILQGAADTIGLRLLI
jgi:hypothetical protein